jgi:hypothetical protein
VDVHSCQVLSKAELIRNKLRPRQALLQRLRSVNGDPQQVGGVISKALVAWGPTDDNQIGLSHKVNDDADCLAIRLSHIIADF